MKTHLVHDIPVYYLNEVSTPLRVLYSLAYKIDSKDGVEEIQPLMPLAHCKDYVQDIIAGLLLNTEVRTYALKFDPKKLQKPFTKYGDLRVIIDVSALEYSIQRILDVLHNFEVQYKLRKTKMSHITNYQVVLHPSYEVFKHPAILSIWLLLVRCACYNFNEIEISELFTKIKMKEELHDSEYIAQIITYWPQVLWWLNNRRQIRVNLYYDFQFVENTIFHNAYGIRALCRFLKNKKLHESAALQGIRCPQVELFKVLKLI